MFIKDLDARIVHHSIFRAKENALKGTIGSARADESGYFLVKKDKIIGRFDIYLYDDIQRTQRAAPARIVGQGQKTRWLFSDEIYCTDEDLTEEELRRQILGYTSTQSNESRERISEKVRNEVWRRDEGKCVSCASREKLEFDHIIPISKGGSSTVRNIELLCEACNRKKSSRIGWDLGHGLEVLYCV